MASHISFVCGICIVVTRYSPRHNVFSFRFFFFCLSFPLLNPNISNQQDFVVWFHFDSFKCRCCRHICLRFSLASYLLPYIFVLLLFFSFVSFVFLVFGFLFLLRFYHIASSNMYGLLCVFGNILFILFKFA